MSGIDDPGTPPDIPEEYADTYRDAYLRALAEEEAAAAPPLAPADLPVVAVDEEPEGEPGGWSSRIWLVVLVVAVALLILAAFGLGKLLSDDDSANGSKQPGAQSPSAVQKKTPTRAATRHPARSTTGPVWNGEVVPVVVSAATASCTARPGVDSSGEKVSYDASYSIDDDPTTAWRCDSSGVGQTLTLTLPARTKVGEVGLVPGYAKDDPATGVDRYAENNRITRVRWTLADGVEIVQRLDPDPKDRQMQTIRVPRTATGSITLEILAVKRGPRNTTAISSIGIGAAA